MKVSGNEAEPVFVNVYGAQESIPRNRSARLCIARLAGTTNRVVVTARQAGNRFLGSLKGLQIWALFACTCVTDSSAQTH
jgi:hypothetical protein